MNPGIEKERFEIFFTERESEKYTGIYVNGKDLKKLRKLCKCTQKEAAERIGVSQARISQIEREGLTPANAFAIYTTEIYVPFLCEDFEGVEQGKARKIFGKMSDQTNAQIEARLRVELETVTDEDLEGWD